MTNDEFTADKYLRTRYDITPELAAALQGELAAAWDRGVRAGLVGSTDAQNPYRNGACGCAECRAGNDSWCCEACHELAREMFA